MKHDNILGTVHALYLFYLFKEDDKKDPGSASLSNILEFMEGLLKHTNDKFSSVYVKESSSFNLNDLRTAMNYLDSSFNLLKEGMEQKTAPGFENNDLTVTQKYIIRTYCHKYNDQVLFQSYSIKDKNVRRKDWEYKYTNEIISSSNFENLNHERNYINNLNIISQGRNDNNDNNKNRRYLLMKLPDGKPLNKLFSFDGK